MSVRGHSVAVIPHGWRTEVHRAPQVVRRAPKGPSQPRKAQVALDAGERPGAFWWAPRSPVDSGESDEHPEMLGGGQRARWGTEVLRCTVCRAMSQRLVV